MLINEVQLKYATCIIVFGVPVPMVMIVMGALHLDDCPAQRFIPIYLIVMGCVLFIVCLLALIFVFGPRHGRIIDVELCSFGVLGLFAFAWFIAGNVWIYSLTTQSNDPANTNYCDTTLYKFAFWLTTSFYIVAALAVFIKACRTFSCLGGFEMDL